MPLLFLQSGKLYFMSLINISVVSVWSRLCSRFSAALVIRLGDVLGLLKVFDQFHLKRKKDLLLEQLTVVTGIRQICRLFWREVRAWADPGSHFPSKDTAIPNSYWWAPPSNADAVPRAPSINNVDFWFGIYFVLFYFCVFCKWKWNLSIDLFLIYLIPTLAEHFVFTSSL